MGTSSPTINANADKLISIINKYKHVTTKTKDKLIDQINDHDDIIDDLLYERVRKQLYSVAMDNDMLDKIASRIAPLIDSIVENEDKELHLNKMLFKDGTFFLTNAVTIEEGIKDYIITNKLI